MLYHPVHFEQFCAEKGLKPETFCITEKGRELPVLRLGEGDRWILVSARHHACEATGGYVLQGMIDTLLNSIPEGYSVLVVPFVDYDGVVDGDQGKNRTPFDHNSDYKEEQIYQVTRKLVEFAHTHTLVYSFDFHSPWHQGDINDRVFMSRSTEAINPVVNEFAPYLQEETASVVLHYDRIYDVGPNERWNNENSKISKNFFSRLDSVRLSTTLETPYFGLPESKVSQKDMLNLGNAFGRAALRFIADHS
jgi:hypothetical protein